MSFITKAVFSLCPIFVLMAGPSCAANDSGKLQSGNIQVFASMMNQNPNNPTVNESESADRKKSPKIAFNEAIRVMSFNVLSDDNQEHRWEERKDKVASVIRFHRADIIGMQEPSEKQIADLAKSLPEYQIISGLAA